MRKLIVTVLLLYIGAIAAPAQVVDSKIIDIGSNGPHKAIAAKEANFKSMWSIAQRI